MRIRYAFRHWPSDYDAVMADPVACRLVRLEATGRRRRRPGARSANEHRPHQLLATDPGRAPRAWISRAEPQGNTAKNDSHIHRKPLTTKRQ